MNEWDKVVTLKNIKITVDGGYSSSSIFGNGRNCAVVTVSFNGLTKDDAFVDLGGVDVLPNTYLIDYATGDDLYWNGLPIDQYGLFYSQVKSRYTNYPCENISSSKNVIIKKQARITFYLYGKCVREMKRLIAVKVILPNSNEVSTAKDGEQHKVEILVKRPIQYTADDLEPIKYNEVRKYESGRLIQGVVFAKLKREFKSGWIYCEHYDQELESIEHVSLVNKREDKGFGIYNFLLGDLGKQTQRSAPNTGSYVLEYNHEPEALSLITIKLYFDRGFQSMKEYNDTKESFINLYDTHGNIGRFRLNFKDPISPTFVTVNY